MGRKACCDKQEVNRGAWSAREDQILMNYVQLHGEGKWRDLPKRAGLKRCGKSCRLRWLNYLRPDIKRGNISADEEELIIRLHKLLGNRWSLIAGRLPGRTDNEIKNYWNTNLSKKLEQQQKQQQQHGHAKAPDSGNTNSSNLIVQSPGHPKISFGIDPTKFTYPVIKPRAKRCTKVIVPAQETNDSLSTMNLVKAGWDSQNHHNPSASNPQDGHGNCSAGFFIDFDISDLLVPDEPAASEINEQCEYLVGEGDPDFHWNGSACVEMPNHFGDSLGKTGPENWVLDEFFQPDQAADFSFFL